MTAVEALVRSEAGVLVLALLNVFQTIALAYIADRSRRVRSGDRRTRRRASSRRPPA